ncbi:hypothetical protein [Sporosarcina koreensis]|uniref:hypothetical protein n=1 Tax=Sporosarcina koreensis TaxID=334735 RepID=UPI00058C6B21|nr:hypothetical protein [Sporosarcina koreensis]
MSGKKSEKNRDKARKADINKFLKKPRTFDRIDMNLYYYSKMKKNKKYSKTLKILPIVLLVIQAISVIVFTITSNETSTDEKMIFFAGFVIIVTIMMPIIQYLFSRGDSLTNDKIEFYLLFQNQLLLKNVKLTSEEMQDAEEVLWRIANLESIDAVDEENFLNHKYAQDLSHLAKKKK